MLGVASCDWIRKVSSLVGRILLVGSVLLVFACQQKVATYDVTKSCTELVHEYAYLRDRLDGQGVSELFTEEGEFSIFGETFAGRQLIQERVSGARSGPVTRHLVSTVDVQSDGGSAARGVSYVTIYIGPKSESDNPIEVEGFAGIGEYHDHFALTDSGCKIQSREFIPVFTYQDD